jgi:hypothetical protein
MISGSQLAIPIAWESSCRYDRRPAPFARTSLGQAVKTFQMATAFDSKSGHTRISAKAGYLFIQCHQRDDVIDSLFERQVRVLKWILILSIFPRSITG